MMPLFNTKLFSEVWDTAEKFKNDYLSYEAGIDNLNKVDNKYVILTWQLIASKFGSTPIRSISEDQFKLAVFSIMVSEAPTWVRRLELQKSVRELTEADLLAGDTTIANRAENPDEAPTTGTMDELTYINAQTTSKHKRSKVNAYAMLDSLLQDDLCETYVHRFNSLFKKVYVPATYVYVTEEEDDQ